MDRAKEQIAENFQKKESRYKKVWKIIDTRWNLQIHRPLYAAAYYLNPRFHYDKNFNPDNEVLYGLYETIERMVSDRRTRFLIDQQLKKFKSAKGLFGMNMAIDTRDKKQPTLWWESYGGDGKELQKVAMRILSLTCSATGCERNWSTFDQVHTKRRNRLEQQRLNALVFVKYNLQLEMRQKCREEKGETYDPICLSNIESNDEWIVEKEDPCLPNDASWMDINECFTFEEGASSKKRKRGICADLELELEQKILKIYLFKYILSCLFHYFGFISARNLNAKADKKEKSIIEDDNEIEGIIRDGVEEELLILEDEEDELSDIDLGDDE
ncbi:uncharacterized protein LOC113851979 [Abrus precatorius]|uniref:Uncharacterized protein LOC113851979 n=1 Tax=Abrus precatorius TaxID=3816 RepID=A0A8B8K2U2_ABRPR|nr:uncharacterized protein LOC113851979 [Abrus precatorius]